MHAALPYLCPSNYPTLATPLPMALFTVFLERGGMLLKEGSMKLAKTLQTSSFAGFHRWSFLCRSTYLFCLTDATANTCVTFRYLLPLPILCEDKFYVSTQAVCILVPKLQGFSTSTSPRIQGYVNQTLSPCGWGLGMRLFHGLFQTNVPNGGVSSTNNRDGGRKRKGRGCRNAEPILWKVPPSDTTAYEMMVKAANGK